MKQRARRDEDKAERVGAILAAGREMWSRSSWNDFTMGAVAERAGVAKGTIYLYFPTKEHLLLAVFECLFDEYVDEVNSALERRRGRWSAERVAEAFAKPLRHRHALLRILPLLGRLIEHGAVHTAAIELKLRTLERLAATARLLESRVPSLRHGDGMVFLLRANALLTGLAGMAFPAAVIESDLDREFHTAITALLHGMEK